MNRKVCAYCERDLHPYASEALHLKICEVYKQIYSLQEKTSKQCSKETEKTSTETCMNCKKKIPINELRYHKQSCNKRSRKSCAYCEKELHPDASEALHLKVCDAYQQINSLSEEKAFRIFDEKTNKVKPKVGKCPYCKTILNDNILLFHQKECVYQPIKCPDCSVTILLKDSNSHFCKSTEENIEFSETDILTKHLKELFTNENCWDTVLQVEDKEFKVHRAILSARSSVFSAMFLHDTSEKQTGIVKIPDCDPDCFKDFLEYLYSGKLKNISSDNAAQMYVISDKYNVQELKTFCTKYLMQNITLQNFSEVLILADDHDETNFFSAIQDFFNKHFKDIVITNEWENLLKCNFRLANKLLIGKSKTE